MLQPLKVDAPQELPPRQRALAKLKNIEGIRVDRKVQHDGESFYVIDMFMRSSLARPQSGMVSPASIPRSQLALHDLTSSPQQPLSREHIGNRDSDHHVEKTYLQVFALRDELSTLGFACRGAKRCRLCQEIFAYVNTLDKTPPSIVRALSSSSSKKRDLEKIINAFVGIVVRSQILTTADLSVCKSDERIPVVLQEFLGL